jgi:DNA-directed RNA polymerase specialized sigma24 family protein
MVLIPYVLWRIKFTIMKFNSNTERRAYWETMSKKYSSAAIEKGLNSLKPEIKQVLILHYTKKHSFIEITGMVNRSVTVVRMRHNRGIYKMYRYFNPL